jgi:hypothetical protein
MAIQFPAGTRTAAGSESWGTARVGEDMGEPVLDVIGGMLEQPPSAASRHENVKVLFIRLLRKGRGRERVASPDWS